MAKKKILMRGSVSGTEQMVDLQYAQRILQWQESHPKNEVWELVGDEYIFDTGTNELKRNTNKRSTSEPTT